MTSDWLGNPLTTENDATVSGINDFIEGFLGYESKAANILAAADSDENCCIANAYAAMFWMFLESNEAPANARPYLEKAEAAAAGSNRREQMTTATVRAWVDNDISKALAISDQVADEFHHDLAIVKAAQYHHFNLGSGKGMLQIADKVAAANSEVCYMHGLSAFAHEQCHNLEQAELSARRAIELKRKEPWAHHALAHVMITQGRIDEGITFLEDVSETWTDLNSFMLTHNWWHLALNFISKGRYGDALKLYDKHVWGVWKEYSQDQIGAVSLLLRLELVGVDVGDRWQDVADYLTVRVDDFVQPFLSMQYLYGLTRAGRPEADEMFRNLQEHVKTTPELTRHVWENVTVPASAGMMAHARGDHAQVVKTLGEVRSKLIKAGGSHAQRDLFNQTLLDSTIRTGDNASARSMLEARLKYEPQSIPTNTLLSQAYEALGLRDQAAEARARMSH